MGEAFDKVQNLKFGEWRLMESELVVNCFPPRLAVALLCCGMLSTACPCIFFLGHSASTLLLRGSIFRATSAVPWS